LERNGNEDAIPKLMGKGVLMADNTEKDPKDWVSGDDPMTGAQESYLKTLSEQAHKPMPDKNLTKAEASALIDKLREKNGLEEQRRTREVGRS
jgi:hypothetical protein